MKLKPICTGQMSRITSLDCLTDTSWSHQRRHLLTNISTSDHFSGDFFAFAVQVADFKGSCKYQWWWNFRRAIAAFFVKLAAGCSFHLWKQWGIMYVCVRIWHLKLIASRVSLDVALQIVDPALPEETAPGSICTWISLHGTWDFYAGLFRSKSSTAEFSQLNLSCFSESKALNPPLGNKITHLLKKNDGTPPNRKEGRLKKTLKL